MKLIGAVIVLMLLGGCSGDALEEFAFRKTLEHKLIELCGEDSQECVAAVEAQTQGCMEKSDWRKFVASQDDAEELKRFTTEFYTCIVDDDGKPYFVANL